MSLLIDVLNPNPVVTNTSGQLSGLVVNGIYLSTTVFSNMSGDLAGSGGGGYPLAWGVLYTGNPTSGAWGASGSPAIYGWILPAFNGIDFETPLQTAGTTTTQPVARAADFVWPLDSNTSGQVRPMLAPVPICSGMKMLFWNQAGELLGASGCRCSLHFTTDGTT